ncbi:MAG: UDP-N-acetylmuramoyl-L-alanine--D-glutamate ligase, partial [Comamonas sp.]|nr:UDP-N-acetylmuramoyl-L-alanine--D-glutamate ligase [Comamonas sp.]
AVMDMLPAPIRLKGGKFAQRPYPSFGIDRPQQPGDFGLETTNGMTWLVRAHDEDGQGLKTAPNAPAPAAQELHIQRLMPADALRIRGRHNACNALAALALAQAAGCALAPLLYALREYRGEPHRVQSLGVVDGVEYIDDSKGTNVGATLAALEGLGGERRLVVIVGGLGKGQDFSPLAQPLVQYARAVVLIGQDAPLLRSTLVQTELPLLDAVDMPQAVALASAQAHYGDAVLLSPACASMDMFDSYEHRALVFAAAVQELADQPHQGEP